MQFGSRCRGAGRIQTHAVELERREEELRHQRARHEADVGRYEEERQRQRERDEAELARRLQEGQAARQAELETQYDELRRWAAGLEEWRLDLQASSA